MNLKTLVLQIIHDFPEGITHAQLLHYVMESGYWEEKPGILSEKVHEIVLTFAKRKCIDIEKPTYYSTAMRN